MTKFIQPHSSFITAMGYDSQEHQLSIYIRGKGYHYRDVSRHTWYRLRKATSQGSYFSRNIKGKYERASA